MRTSRRSFIRSASSVGVLATLPGWAWSKPTAEKPLDILILGGTGFIGPHEISYFCVSQTKLAACRAVNQIDLRGAWDGY